MTTGHFLIGQETLPKLIRFSNGLAYLRFVFKELLQLNKLSTFATTHTFFKTTRYMYLYFNSNI